MYYTVYKITNLIDGKIYIGVHKTNNLDDGYMGSGKYLRRAIEKYGIENFHKEYLAIFDTSEEMFEMESELVNEDFVKNKETYNLKLGGEGGFDYLNSTGKNHLHNNRKKSIENLKLGIVRQKWLWENDEDWANTQRKALSNRAKIYFETHAGTFKGKKHTIETKKIIGEKAKIYQKGERNSQYGTIWIYNLELKESKKIKKDDFPNWKQDGWLKGRKMKF